MSALVEFPVDRLPSAPDAERAILAALMLSPVLVAQVVHLVRPEWFASERHRPIYRAIHDLAVDGCTTDPVLVIERLRDRDELDKAGGAAFITELLDSMPRVESVDAYCRVVRDKAQLRALMAAGSRQISDATGGDVEPSVAIADAIERLQRIASGGAVDEDDGAAVAAGKLAAQLNDSRLAEGAQTGFPTLDRFTNGIRRKQQWILAAYSSVGKSAFAGSIALQAARCGRWVDVLTFEMSAEEYASRLISLGWQIDLLRLTRGRLYREEYEIWAAARAEFERLPLRICEASGRSTRDIRARANRFRARGELDLLVVDYMGLVEPANSKATETESVRRIARDLKIIAGEANCGLLTLHQINREGAKSGGEPQLWWLRNAGEADADVVLFLTRDDGADAGRCWLKKQRNGPTGDFPLQFDGAFARYYE